MTTIASIAAGDPRFSILVAAIGFIDNENGTDYLGILGDASSDLTVFAPTNGAFVSLAVDLGFAGDPDDIDAVGAFLLGLGADLLETVVTYHVSAGAQFTVDIASAGSVTTLQGGVIDATELPTLGDAEPDLIDPSLVATDIPADNGVIHVIDRVLLPIDLPGNDAPTITAIAVASGPGFDDNGGDFDILREAVVTAGLAGVLDDPNADFTVFAPTDAAFMDLATALGFDGSTEADAFAYLVDALRLLSGGGDPIPLLTEVLTYHVAGQSLQASQVIAAGAVTTLQGGTLTLDGLSLVDAEPDLRDPGLVATDIQAANGVVHVIDGVLLPADLLQSDGSNDVDFVIGDDGRDKVWTGADNDLIDGKGGSDVLGGGAGNDLILGGDGGDFVYGGRGADTLLGENGRDIVKGGSGSDSIDGGADNDLLHGDRGHDVIEGGDGDDFIFGGSGNDTIIGGAGNDRLFGGWGEDVFAFGPEDAGHDAIIGFRSGTDKIDLTAYGFENFDAVADHLEWGWFSTRLDLGDTQVSLIGVWKWSLDADDFLL
ncbi:fasciclin domain-containing protein [Thetidibacter halocola]|uniref:Fasciclin domain-containing protein n=1 Tax=Thetidibacter halocola TaxID=2827239 RepID=A0A8J7WI79_9RHOB|nr:fasciclin domain-containing protein [Thetidibacter halocola]MBS0126096.1 fasciclin domain-containing protein [Thetidibacter halocola]